MRAATSESDEAASLSALSSSTSEGTRFVVVKEGVIAEASVEPLVAGAAEGLVGVAAGSACFSFSFASRPSLSSSSVPSAWV